MFQSNVLADVPADAGVAAVRAGWATFTRNGPEMLRSAAAELMHAAEENDYRNLAALFAKFGYWSWSGVSNPVIT